MFFSHISLAAAVAADTLIVTGGSSAAVLDFMHALQEKKSIVLVENPSLPTGFDDVKGRPLNAAEYITKMIQAVDEGKEQPYPEVSGLTTQFVKENRAEISRLVSVDDINNPRYYSAYPIITSSASPAVGGTDVKEVARPANG